LTLETAVFFAATFLLVALLTGLEATLAAGFLSLALCLDGAAFFVADFVLAAVFFAATFATVALLAFGLEAGLAFTARFAAFEEARFAAVRAVDRRKPFERLLLISFYSTKAA
jgi:hypothetical protein